MKLVIANTSIHQDAEGRYSLNDLHRASGGEKKHGPSYWMATQQTQEVIAHLETTGKPVVILEGRKGGTYVCKELVYSYAMWISAEFHLHVIRAYDAMISSATQQPIRCANADLIRAHKACVDLIVKAGVPRPMATAVGLQAMQADIGMTTECYRQALPGIEDVCNLNQKQLGDILESVFKHTDFKSCVTVEESDLR